ncbi:hypothetical protein NQ317_012841 [Molorchus minor]|uniref:Uncharacterized protein n=1 Tax=Molorchus minor TaxID=1323400 RepID=A0ABQ9ITH9_9CUCU|nr:hypothetical protein NQ317_012841 [Molorchus minor]
MFRGGDRCSMVVTGGWQHCQGHATWIWETATSVISVNHADADQPPSLYLAPMASQNYLFGSLTDGDTDADWQKVAIFVNKTHVVWIYFGVLIL